ncbi:hypothetical protein V8E36_001358 [Tilletia maclaganii]
MPPASRRSTPRRGRSSSVLSADEPVPTTTGASAQRVTKARNNRPDLPKGTNSALPEQEVPVKLQIIEREGKDIIIGRVKLPLPAPTSNSSSPDHAFLLKRFDTNALAASSMFKIAFPYANADEERVEMEYLERRFDCDAANGGSVHGDDGAESTAETPKRGRPRPRKSTAVPSHTGTGVRLQGTWIPAGDAVEVADEYRILKYARGLIDAQAELDDHRQLFLVTPDGERIAQASSKRAAAKSNGNEGGSSAVAETPRRKRARQSEAGTTTTSTTTTTVAGDKTTPSVVRTKTTRTVGPDGSEEVRVERTETTVGTVISPEEANTQLEEARAFAISKRAEAAAGGSAAAAGGSRKRRAVTDAPRDGTGAAGEEDEYVAPATSNALVTTVRRGARAVQRRPIVSAAGLVGATAAAGAGALAYASGGDLQAAIQLAQQGLASLGLANLSGIFSF